MTLYSYVVARDYGFAPNPFNGWCTLATCKPVIRRVAKVGDWIVGTGSKSASRDGKLVFVMRVAETLTFEQYWADERFLPKRPAMSGSKKQAFGDNIYHRRRNKSWVQENSHHSKPDGSPNPYNIVNDTKTNRVLVGSEFAYWGGNGPDVPAKFREYDGIDIVHQGRNHICAFPDILIRDFVAWVRKGPQGYLGEPLDWRR